jgi:hypothetical protein
MTIRNVRDHGQRFRPRMACLKKVGRLAQSEIGMLHGICRHLGYSVLLYLVIKIYIDYSFITRWAVESDVLYYYPGCRPSAPI